MNKEVNAVMDMGSSEIRVLLGASATNGSFVVYGESSVPYSGFSDGEFFEPERLECLIGKAIENLEIKTQYSIKELTVGIPAEFCVCKNRKITVTFPSRRKLNDILIDEIYASGVEKIEDHTLITTEPIYNILDDGRKLVNVCGHKTSKLSTLISTIYANNYFIELLNDCFSKLGIVKVSYVCTAFAEQSYFFPPNSVVGSVALVDIGYLSSEVSVIRGAGLTNLVSFSMGGAHIMADLAECLELTLKEAEELKRTVILSLDASPQDIYQVDGPIPASKKTVFAKVANQIVFDRLDDMAFMIKKALEDVPRDEYLPIYLTGGGISYIKGAREYLSGILGQSIELISPQIVGYNKPHNSAILSILAHVLKNSTKKHVGMLAKWLK